MLYDLNDYIIVPAKESNISSRKEVDIYYDNFLPLFTAPMDTVVDKSNAIEYLKHKINVCPTREIRKEEYFKLYYDSIYHLYNGNLFNTESLESFKILYIDNDYRQQDRNPTVLIDVANGHMKKLSDLISLAKIKYGNQITIMAGNIAHPERYHQFAELGLDYLRVGIGSGNACLTSQQTAIGYPMGSLIKECRELKEKYNLNAKIVADGGMKSYADIIKSLALGADFVMVGSLFNKCVESSGKNFIYKNIPVSDNLAQTLYDMNFNIYKSYRGMSSKEVQKSWGKKKLTTSEGINTKRLVEYRLSKWVENFEDYLRSAMSYTNCRNLKQFIGKVQTEVISNNSLLRFKK